MARAWTARLAPLTVALTAAAGWGAAVRPAGASTRPAVRAKATAVTTVGRTTTTTVRRATARPAPATTTTAAVPTTTAPPVSPSQYVDRVLTVIETYSIKKRTVDLVALRADAMARAAQARTIADTYPIVADVIKRLGDRHSTFQKPIDASRLTAGKYEGYGFTATWPQRVVILVAPGSPAEDAGLRANDRIELIDGAQPRHTDTNIVVSRGKDGQLPEKVTLTVRRPGEGGTRAITIRKGEPTLVSVPTAKPVERVIDGRVVGRIGYVDILGIIGDQAAQDAYAATVQANIRTMDADARCGWVVDLRKNRGGYIYPMLAGLGPVVGEGVLAGKVNADGRQTMWTYRNGQLYNGEDVVSRVNDPYRVKVENAPVAVLTSGLTASAGEATLLAFVERPNTRRFGEPTVGLTSFTSAHAMPDGAILVVTSELDVDRTGRAYDGPIDVDERVPTDWSQVGTEADPVLNAAVAWLASQGTCAAP